MNELKADTSRLNLKNTLLNTLLNNEQLSLIVAFFGLCVIISFLAPNFLTVPNISNMLYQASIEGIAAFGACLVLLVGEIDLTVGTLQGAGGCLMVYTLNKVFNNFFLAVLITLALGAIVGLANSLIITKGKINSFIATLGTMAVIRGLTMASTKAAAIVNNHEGFDYLGTGKIAGIPITIFIFTIMGCATFYLLNFTVLGRTIYAVGGNVNAARLSGINTDKIKIIVFVIAGVLASLTSIISASRMNSGQPNAGTNFEFLVITAVILGGVSMTGGRGNVFGVILGILILKVLNNGLVLMNISSFYQDVARGIVILLAVYLDEKRKRDLGRKLLQNNT